MAASLGLFAGAPASYFEDSPSSFAWLSGPRARPRRGWRPAQTGPGSRVLFHGYLDNAAILAAELGLSARHGLDAIYAAALDRWGEDADGHCIGVYCSIAVEPDGNSIRLARSPFEGPPLHYFRDSGRAVAASVPRAIFAAGVERTLNRHRIIQNLLYYHSDDDAGWYVGLREVRPGTVVTLTRANARTRRFYDPAEFATRNARLADAPERAFALLTEAAQAVSRSMTQPAMLLSGGLDSPLAALAMLEARPAESELRTFTFTPCRDWDGMLEPRSMGDERPLVEALAARYPRLQTNFFSNEGIGFDHRMRDLFAATDVGPAGLPNFAMYHALWQSAVDQGCDGIATAEFGNFSYSVNSPWACSAFFLAGRWGELAASLRARRGDGRSALRRIAALVLMPQLPLPWRRAVRRLRGAHRTPLQRHFSALNPALFDHQAALDRDGHALDPFEGFAPRDHREFVGQWLDGDMGNASDIHQGFEQLYGIRRRDITVYRPLIEFCLGLEIDEFELAGEGRRLARRMGAGRLPEEIRTNQLYGRHGVDWHVRIGRQREALLGELRRYRADPDMSALLDLDRGIAALENWPERTTYDLAVQGACLGVVTRATMTARFVHFVEGRNDL